MVRILVASRRPWLPAAPAPSSQVLGLGPPALVRRVFGQRRRQRRLAVIHVPDGADVHVGLGALEFGLRHGVLGPLRCYVPVCYPFTFATICSATCLGTSA